MRIALLGDIHGNALALHAVLEAASEEGVEKLLITGDLVGYYFSPGKVLELLEPWDKIIVRGNHEEMLTLARNDPSQLTRIDRAYGSGLRLALDELSTTQLDMLDDLPHPLKVEIDGFSILLCHGSPWDSGHYIYPDTPHQLYERCAEPDADMVVMGHTHYPMLQRIMNKSLVNPGSVGQPRNRCPGAWWAMLDTCSDEKIVIKRENYNIQAVVDEAKLRHPELPHLARVLLRT